jgi:ADP-L-glycero-D-manno-heptose 6-epimerase
MNDTATYIVTGGAGFVGSNLVAALLSRTPRPRVLVIDTFRSGTFANIVEACERKGVAAFEGGVIAGSTARVDFDRVLSATGASAMFHLGAITDTTVDDEAEMIRENVDGFPEMMRACAWRGIPLVYASSAATYGSPPQGRDRVPFPVSVAGRPGNVYGFSKWLMECEHRRFAKEAAGSGGAQPQIVGLRYFNVFGPGESHKGKMASMVYQLAMQVVAGKRPRIFADGSQARDQVYVDDVVECTLAAAGSAHGQPPAGGARPLPPKPGVYNLGSGVATTFNEMVGAVRQGLGVSEEQATTEYFEMPESIRAFYQDYTCADMSETEQVIGWKPKRKPVEAMVEYAGWLKAGRGRGPHA